MIVHVKSSIVSKYIISKLLKWLLGIRSYSRFLLLSDSITITGKSYRASQNLDKSIFDKYLSLILTSL